jgi:hypothetical protein
MVTWRMPPGVPHRQSCRCLRIANTPNVGTTKFIVSDALPNADRIHFLQLPEPCGCGTQVGVDEAGDGDAPAEEGRLATACDNYISMDDAPRKKQWWLIATAGILAVLTLYYYTDSWLIAALFLAAAAALVTYHARRGAKPSSHACLRCGATLNPNARQCNACGSASWTIRN